MGPRPFGRGRLNIVLGAVHVFWGFNGAAAFRPRKVHEGPCTECGKPKLQWGRGLSAAEGQNTGRKG